jgi:hypothetical protein
MNSVDFTVFELFDTDLFEAASEESDLDDGDFGIGLGLAVVPISVARDFFVGELLLNVKDLLDGRSRLVPSALLPCEVENASCAESFLVLVVGWSLGTPLPSDSPIDGMDVVESRGVSSLCVRTKSALTSIFKVRIAAR